MKETQPNTPSATSKRRRGHRGSKNHRRTEHARNAAPSVQVAGRELPYDTHAEDLRALEKKIGYRFRHRELLLRALTHTTYANDPEMQVQSNERLEFLGDRILSFVVDKYLFDTHPDLMEGDLTKLHSFVVANDALAEYAGALELTTHLRIARGTRIGGTKIPADVFEALLAAMYLDRQKPDKVIPLVLRFVKPMVAKYRQEIDWEHMVRDVDREEKQQKQRATGSKR